MFCSLKPSKRLAFVFPTVVSLSLGWNRVSCFRYSTTTLGRRTRATTTSTTTTFLRSNLATPTRLFHHPSFLSDSYLTSTSSPAKTLLNQFFLINTKMMSTSCTSTTSSSYTNPTDPGSPLPFSYNLVEWISSKPILSTVFFNTDGDFTLTRVAAGVVVPVFAILVLILYLYRSAIIEKLRQLEEDSLLFGLQIQMTRILNNPQEQQSSAIFRHLQLLEIQPNTPSTTTHVVQPKQEGTHVEPQLMSLGEYLRQLKPAMLPASIQMKDVPAVLQAEMGAALSAALLKALGPNLGRAVLPFTGMATQGPTKALASALAGRALAMKTTNNDDKNQTDRAGLPLNLMSVLAVSEVNAKVQELLQSPLSRDGNANAEETELVRNHPNSQSRSTTAIEKMKLGETGNEPSFASDEFFPHNRFCLETDLPRALQQMEAILSEQANVAGQMCKDECETRDNLLSEIGGIAPSINSVGGYKPDGRMMSPPIPINPRLLPDLHLGWGNAQCTHTNREVLLNRLMAVLMNKLASNYYHKYKAGRTDMKDDFVVVWNDQQITTPSGLVNALVESGHHVEAAITTHVTTFGIALCVKEKDGSFSNIPLACFLDSGYENRNGKPASVAMPHSGLDLDISGPLFGDRGDGQPAQVNIQHFIAIDGFCGWFTNHNADVSWIQSIDCGPRLVGADAARATQLAALYATCLNGLATERNLPFGGYGLTAVCNDSAAVLEQCLHGTCSIYPMTSIGSYLMRTVRYAAGLRDSFRELEGMEEEVKALGKILHAMGKIPSDLNASPSDAVSAAQRILHGLPKYPCFQLMRECRTVMESLLEEEAIGEVSSIDRNTNRLIVDRNQQIHKVES